MNSTELLLAREHIKELKHRYFRSIDTKDWDGLAATLAEDCEFHSGSPGQERVTKGRATIVEWVKAQVGTATAVHQALMPEITVVDDGHAHAIWAMSDWNEGWRSPCGSPG